MKIYLRRKLKIMVWHDPDEQQFEEIDATWGEFSQFNKENFRFLTFSEIDHLERPKVFCIEQNVPAYGAINRDFVPLNFLSILFLQSHKGNHPNFSFEACPFFFEVENEKNHSNIFL